jgi:hypothetical protein
MGHALLYPDPVPKTESGKKGGKKGGRGRAEKIGSSKIEEPNKEEFSDALLRCSRPER